MFNELFVGILGAVVQEPVHFFNRRWQARQIQTQTPDQRDLVRFRCGRELFLFQARQDKIIDRIFHPAVAWCRWNGWPHL